MKLLIKVDPARTAAETVDGGVASPAGFLAQVKQEEEVGGESRHS
jgi:hypothetical protein